MNNTTNKISPIAKYEIVDLGIDHPDYFQGFGTSFTEFDHCTYGVGHNPESAFEDCLDMLASMEGISGLDWEAFRNDIIGENKWVKFKSPKASGECYYHIGIRYSLESDCEV